MSNFFIGKTPPAAKAVSTFLRTCMSIESKKRDLVVTRVFDAPVKQVWNAWSDPEHVKRWWGPDGFTYPAAGYRICPGPT